MADWIFQGNPQRHNDLDASVAASRERWWGTPRYRDRMAVGDRVWLQIVGPKAPGIYYVAMIVSGTYEHPVQPSDPAHFRWRTDIRFDYRIRPPLLRSELLEDGHSDRSARSVASRVRTCPCRRRLPQPWPREPPRASSRCHPRTAPHLRVDPDASGMHLRAESGLIPIDAGQRRRQPEDISTTVTT